MSVGVKRSKHVEFCFLRLHALQTTARTLLFYSPLLWSSSSDHYGASQTTAVTRLDQTSAQNKHDGINSPCPISVIFTILHCASVLRCGEVKVSKSRALEGN